VVREHLYHQDFNFSHSIKAVAPALVPGFGYGDLGVVSDGGAAADAFLRLASGRLMPGEDVKSLRTALLEKGLRAMNSVPSGLHQPLGVELSGVAERAPSSGTAGKLGELIGGFLGGLSKSIASG
jgi:hypothetical protein